MAGKEAGKISYTQTNREALLKAEGLQDPGLYPHSKAAGGGGDMDYIDAEIV